MLVPNLLLLPIRRKTLPRLRVRNEIVTIENPETGERQERKWKKAKALVEEGWRLV